MRTKQAVEHFESQIALAKALHMAQSSISEWGEYPPPLRQLQIQEVTKGKLKAEPGVLTPKRRAEARA